MFSIDVENTIRLQSGEGSSLFPIIINKGINKEPIYHLFTPTILLFAKNELNARVDKEKFMRRVGVDGMYSFTYINGFWQLEEHRVHILDYGIKYSEYYLKPYDTIVIYFHKEIDEVYFYILDYNMDISEDQYYVKKTFTAEGTVYTKYFNASDSEIDTDIPLLDKNGLLLLYIGKEDTLYLTPGTYLYLVQSKLYNFKRGRYEVNTVIPQNKFYLIG